MRRLALAVATVGGIGAVPVASGTVGTLPAVPLLPVLAALRARSPVAYGLFVVALVAVAVWAAGAAEEILGGHDHSQIVIDEVAGLVMAGIFLPGTWLATGIAFFLFRLFDILKPFPASVFDRRVPGGVGVVGDDLIAGIYAGLLGWVVLRVLQ